MACRGVLYAISADDAQTLLTVAAEDWIVTLWESAEVRAGVPILAGVTEASMRRAYAAWDAEETREYPEHGDKEDLQYIWAYFQDAREFAVEAAGAERAVLFIADQ